MEHAIGEDLGATDALSVGLGHGGHLLEGGADFLQRGGLARGAFGEALTGAGDGLGDALEIFGVVGEIEAECAELAVEAAGDEQGDTGGDD